MRESTRLSAVTHRRIRRRLLFGAAALSVVRNASPGEPSGFSLALIGQCLIQHDLRAHPWPGLVTLSRQLHANTACFSDLETAIRGPRESAPTRSSETLHTADPVVLDCLRDFGVSFLATSNNHAFDIGTGGILDTIDALEARGLPFAGSGRTLAAAASPAYLQTPAGRLAVVAAAAGKIREGGAATVSRPGVHELRGAAGGLEADDVERMLVSLRSAAREARVVIAYLHNHLWESEVSRTPEWQRAFARRCIDAGANVFVAHGAPLLHGIELYRGAPLFHGLGSFIFQTRKDSGAYGEPNWESLIAECQFKAGKFAGARLTPVALAPVGVDGAGDFITRGRPSPASALQARATLARVAGLSRRFGYRLRFSDLDAVLAAD
jgi:poly-gamma-glutamate synthesis protein (capsule biosynthesis protein)